MKRVATAVVLIPLVLAVVWVAPSNWFLFFLGVIALLTAREYLQLVLQPGELAFYRFVLVVIAAIFALAILASTVNSFKPASVALSVILLAPLLFLGLGLKLPSQTRAVIAAGVSMLGIAYIGMPLLSIWIIRDHINPTVGSFLVLVTFATVWSGDIAAFYIGRVFGRHKLAPIISPGKTWEGAISSTIFASIVCWAMFRLLGPRYSDFFFAAKITAPAWLSLGVGVLINIAAQIGDLAESMIKRAVGVKDSGKLLPGHGGILDRIDALLFAAPVAMLLFWFLRSFIIVTRSEWVLP